VEAGAPVPGLDLVGLEREALARQHAFERRRLERGDHHEVVVADLGDLGHDRVEGLVAGVDHRSDVEHLDELGDGDGPHLGAGLAVDPLDLAGAQRVELVAQR